MNYRVGDTFRKVDLENAIQYTKNKNDEIIGVDFKLEEVYKALGLVSAYLHKSLETPEIRETILKYYQKDMSSRLGNIILSVPVGVASSNLYFANLGPRVPVRISYMGYIGASVRLKLENYGINNVLISIFIDCSITNEIIIPTLKNNIQHHYSILVASKLIQGNVPSYYGGTMETKSNILNVPIP